MINFKLTRKTGTHYGDIFDCYQDRWGQWVYKEYEHEFLALDSIITEELIDIAFKEGIEERKQTARYHGACLTVVYAVEEAFYRFNANRNRLDAWEEELELWGKICDYGHLGEHFMYVHDKIWERIQELEKIKIKWDKLSIEDLENYVLDY